MKFIIIIIIISKCTKHTAQIVVILLFFCFQFIDTMVNINITSVCQVSVIILKD